MTAINIIELGDAKRFGDLMKDIMNQAHLGQDLYPKNLAGDFELIVRRSGSYQELVQRQGQRNGCDGHNGGRGNGDSNNNYRNHRVSFLQQGESNSTTPVPSIDGVTIDAECYYCHVPNNFSNNRGFTEIGYVPESRVIFKSFR